MDGAVLQGDLFEGERTEFEGERTEMALADLPPFLRLLLTTDGTVTKSLEAFYWESVNVTQVEQHLRTKVNSVVPTTHPQTSSTQDLPAAQELIRKVKLVGARSERPYARALSCVQIELLPPHLAQDLLAGDIGIGELVRASGLDTFRQILDLGLYQGADGLEIWRQYAIYFNHLPLIDITEWFPLALYR